MRLKAVLILISCFLISSCSTKYAYNYLDWALEWYAGKYVTLTDDQQWTLGNTIDTELSWHRRNELPKYVALLDQVSEDIKSNVSLTKLKKLYAIQEEHWNTVKSRLAPQMASLLLNLKKKQVKELFENLEEQNRELEEEYVEKSKEELIEQRAERMIDRLEDWLDDLTRKQKKIVYEWSQQFYPLSERWLSSRRKWQSALHSAFEHRDDPEKFRQITSDLFNNNRQFWNQEHSRIFYANIELTLALFAELHSTLTEEQTEYLLGEIRSLRNQLDELSREA